MWEKPVPELLQLGRTSIAEAFERLHRTPGVLAAVDGTCGNGHDTLFMATMLRKLRAAFPDGAAWRMLAFDVQRAALEETRARLEQAGLDRDVVLLHQGHERLEDALAAEAGPLSVGVAVYNLGYLPRSDKRITTKAGTTLASLETAARNLAPHGLILVHAYGGHAGGADELAAVASWCGELSPEQWLAAQYAFCNKKRNPETLFLVTRKDAAHA